MELVSFSVLVMLSFLVLACMFLLGRAIGFSAGFSAAEKRHREHADDSVNASHDEEG